VTFELLAVWAVRLLAVYAGLGVLFALVFLARGLERVDAAAREATLGFRLVALPATAALWPLLLRRWLGARGAPPVETNAHRRAAARREGR